MIEFKLEYYFLLVNSSSGLTISFACYFSLRTFLIISTKGGPALNSLCTFLNIIKVF